MIPEGDPDIRLLSHDDKDESLLWSSGVATWFVLVDVVDSTWWWSTAVDGSDV